MSKLFLVLALLVVTACSKPKTELQQFKSEQAALDPELTKSSTTLNKHQPVWVDNSDREGQLTAVGIAASNPLKDLSLQRTIATNRGMAVLAQKLELRVESLFEELKSLNATGGKKVSEQALSETRNTTRILVRQKLRGAKVPSFWTDHQTGNLFVLCQLNDDASMQVLKQAVANQPELNSALENLNKTIKQNP